MATLALPAGVSTRPARDGDQQSIAEMLAICEQALFGSVEDPLSATLDWIRNTWRTGDFDVATDSLVAIAPDERIIGYVTVWRPADEPHNMVASPNIHPDFHGQGLGTWMLRWAEQRARELAETLSQDQRVVLSSWVDEINGAARELLTNNGFAPKRYLWTMQIEMESAPPAPAWPDGIHGRNFVPGQDERATHAMLSKAFTREGDDPYENFEEWCRFYNMTSESFDPSLWFLAVTDDNEIVGTTLGEFRQDGTQGWIYEVAVRDDWRKRGLALALLHQAFGAYHRRGIPRVALTVDSANPTGATRLYERAGMHATQRGIIRYRKELRAAMS